MYQQHVLAFVDWARDTCTITRLEQLDERAEELATAYLQLHLSEGRSAYTLQAERSALRLFFQNRSLAQEITLPRRTRTAITRSRGPAQHDRHIQLANWQPLVRFLQATGLRRNEVSILCVGDIVERDPEYGDRLTVKVRNGKGGKSRTVPVLDGHEHDVACMKEGHTDEDLVFSRIPKHLDVHSYRRAFAQALYLTLAPGRSLPPSTGRLKRGDYDADAVMEVSKALGHNRRDVVLRHYIR